MMNKDSLKGTLDECDKNINALKRPVPSSFGIWSLFMVFVSIIIVPFFIFPLFSVFFDIFVLILSKGDYDRVDKNLLDVVKSIFYFIKNNNINFDMSKFEAVSHQNYMYMIIYAIPMGIVITHAISVSAWKLSVREEARFRMYKLDCQKMQDLLSCDMDEKDREMVSSILSGGFVDKRDNDDSSHKDQNIHPIVDIAVKIIDKINKNHLLDKPNKSDLSDKIDGASM